MNQWSSCKSPCPQAYFPCLVLCSTDEADTWASIPWTSHSQTYSVPVPPLPPWVFQGLRAIVSLVSAHPALLACAPAVIPCISSICKFTPTLPRKLAQVSQFQNKTDTLPSGLCPLNTSDLLSPPSGPFTHVGLHGPIFCPQTGC